LTAYRKAGVLVGSTIQTLWGEVVGPAKTTTVKEVSSYLKVHPTTIYRRLKRKQIPAFHVGGSWRFNIETIDRWRLQLEKLAD